MQVSLTFVVYDWDGPLVGDDLLGVAKLNLQQVNDHTHSLSLGSRPSPYVRVLIARGWARGRPGYTHSHYYSAVQCSCLCV